MLRDSEYRGTLTCVVAASARYDLPPTFKEVQHAAMLNKPPAEAWGTSKHLFRTELVDRM